MPSRKKSTTVERRSRRNQLRKQPRSRPRFEQRS
jgi:hypothetical protein